MSLVQATGDHHETNIAQQTLLRSNWDKMSVLTELTNSVNLPEAITLDERVICDLSLLLSGAFEPVTGFLGLADYVSVMDKMRLQNGSVWAMPIILPVKFEQCGTSDENVPVASGKGETKQLFLRDKTGKIVSKVTVTSIFKPDLEREQKSVFGTTSENHPYVKFMNDNYVDVFYIGGTLESLNGGVKRFDYRQYRRSAAEVRKIIQEKGCTTVVGFQTRNPMHRAHMELTVQALREAHSSDPTAKSLIMLTPAVGPTQPGDVPMPVRIKCYEHLLPYYQKLNMEEFPNMDFPELVLLPIAMRMGGPREAVWHAQIRRNYGCTHFIVGRDHAGPSAKNEQGSPFYGPYEAHELLESVESEIGIKVCYAKMFAYCGPEHNFLPVDKIPEGVTPMNVSGTEQRELLQAGTDLPHYFSFPEVSEELRNFYRKPHKLGLVLYLTGLPCSGKSTIAEAIQARLEVEDRRAVTILDGDIVRTHLSKGLGFSREDRSVNVQRIGYVAGLVGKSGGVAIAANIAPFEEDRAINRRVIEEGGATYVEIFVDTPLATCEVRDVKGLYANARAGLIDKFTGISDPYERPVNPDIVLTCENSSVDENVDVIFNWMRERELVLC